MFGNTARGRESNSIQSENMAVQSCEPCTNSITWVKCTPRRLNPHSLLRKIIIGGYLETSSYMHSFTSIPEKQHAHRIALPATKGTLGLPSFLRTQRRSFGVVYNQTRHGENRKGSLSTGMIPRNTIIIAQWPAFECCKRLLSGKNEKL